SCEISSGRHAQISGGRFPKKASSSLAQHITVAGASLNRSINMSPQVLKEERSSFEERTAAVTTQMAGGQGGRWAKRTGSSKEGVLVTRIRRRDEPRSKLPQLPYSRPLLPTDEDQTMENAATH
ncbi:hypothetical protein F7725_000523, partial [Dissostichus mawsoni]